MSAEAARSGVITAAALTRGARFCLWGCVEGLRGYEFRRGLCILRGVRGSSFSVWIGSPRRRGERIGSTRFQDAWIG